MRVDSKSANVVRPPIYTFASRIDYTAFEKPIEPLRVKIGEDEVNISDRARSMLAGTASSASSSASTASLSVDATDVDRAVSSTASSVSDDAGIGATFNRSELLQQRAKEMLTQANQASNQLLHLFR